MSSDREECVLCCRNIQIYATGNCDHPVCYECSTRMRVLCETNECPICRSDMPVVIFTKELKAFSSIDKKFSLLNKKYQILFEDESILKEFELLLENKCKSCGEVMPSFAKLDEHNRRKHDLHFCVLCTNNLKIFTFERKCYSRKDLARHKRLGDPDQKSHRGHPICEFCDERYVDSDDLFRHLRREHFFCHFCDADGKHQYYNDYDYLRQHFRDEHYLCEEEDCAHEKFTSAFRTEIDKKSHIAIHHCKNKSKADAKQARMLDLEFNYAPHNRPSGGSSPRGGRYGQYRKERRNVEENGLRDRNRSSQQPEIENINTQSVQEFPYLSDDIINRTANDISAPENMLNSLSLQSYNRNPNPYRRNIMSADEFPALNSNSTASNSEASSNQNRKMNSGIVKQNNTPAKTSNASNQPTQKNTLAQNLSATSGEQKTKGNEFKNGDTAPQQNSKWLPKKSNATFEEEFPMLAVKKTPKPPAVPVPPAATTVVPDNTVFVSVVKKTKNPESILNDQFLVIKSKSKRKKHIKVPPLDTESKDESSSKVQTLEYESVNDEGNTNKFKSNMVHPVLASRSVPYRVSDAWEEKVSFGSADFPPLEAPIAPPKKPPGFKNPKARVPPPGFGQNLNVNSEPQSKVLSLSAVAAILKQGQSKPNGVDNSTSEQNNCNLDYVFSRPPNFDQRNQELIIRITTLPTHDSKSFQEFKQMSGWFRANDISATIFHDKCLDILGRKGFQDIFPELVTLLPDIKKQQELLTVHNKYLWQRGENNEMYPIVSCSTCNQVLINRDYVHHIQMHDLKISQ